MARESNDKADASTYKNTTTPKPKPEKTESKTFCIIGDPIDHSLSPLIHNSAFAALKLNYSYIAFKVPCDELEGSIDSLRKIGIAGFNVTIPHKVNIIKFLDHLSPEARIAGAVNTVNNENGRLVGYNTDIYGIMAPLEKQKVDFNNLEILILGAGGACRAALVALSSKKNGIKKINIVNRNQEKLEQVLKLGKDLGLNCFPMDYVNPVRLRENSLNSRLIINTTSIGLKNESSPLQKEWINKDALVFDIVYRPIFTDLLDKSKEIGAHIIFGYEMLLYQGARSFEIWTGINAPIDIMKKALLGVFGEPR
ncbi:MAG: shikimate dehydrogenase [Thermoproteota archaeon]|nr:shikimate dehydrogenase [Thermoproteota archaeon]